jgi:CoA:oxalate CoA-transferase
MLRLFCRNRRTLRCTTLAAKPDEMPATPSRRPLDGVRVLDLSRVVSGPVAGRILSDLGADVVKLESPDGDVTRLWGANINGTPGFFLQQNAGKRGMCLDMKHPSAAALVIEMVRVSHIVIENFRGGVMDRLGIGWSTLHAANPRLVMLSISGFGQTGPEAHRPAYASVIQAEAGILGRQMSFDQRPPSDPITSVADYNAGLHGTIAVLAALRQAEATGVGTHIDIAMIDSMLATDDYVHYALDDETPTRLGGEYYPTGDGQWTVVSGPTNHVFRVLSSAHNIADPASRDADPTEKMMLRRAALREWTGQLSTQSELASVLDALKIAWGRLATPSEAVQSPTVAHRGTIATVKDSAGAQRRVVQTPYRFSHATSGVRGLSPHLGEHNNEILSEWLGWNAEQIASLESDVLQTSGLLPNPA